LFSAAQTALEDNRTTKRLKSSVMRVIGRLSLKQ
jgi:hypothetical protein